jgi:two-component sensor histidine kinase
MLSAALATVAFYSRYLWFDALETRYPFLMGVPVVVITAGVFGAGPAMGAAIMGVLLPSIHLMRPVGNLWIADPVDAFGAGLYLAISALVAVMVCALSSAKSLAVEYALERRRMHRDIRNLLNELRHRTKNELMQLLALTHMMAGGAETPEAKSALLGLAGRIRAVGHVHDILSEVMDQPETPVDSAVFVSGLVEKISSAVGRDGIDIGVQAESHQLRHTAAVPLGIILNELVMNALKHAFPSGVGHISVVFWRDQEDYRMVVDDDGVGLAMCAGDDEAPPRRRGLGQRVIAGLARGLDGKISTLDKEGSGMRCELSFPAAGRLT